MTYRRAERNPEVTPKAEQRCTNSRSDWPNGSERENVPSKKLTEVHGLSVNYFPLLTRRCEDRFGARHEVHETASVEESNSMLERHHINSHRVGAHEWNPRQRLP